MSEKKEKLLSLHYITLLHYITIIMKLKRMRRRRTRHFLWCPCDSHYFPFCFPFLSILLLSWSPSNTFSFCTFLLISSKKTLRCSFFIFSSCTHSLTGFSCMQKVIPTYFHTHHPNHQRNQLTKPSQMKIYRFEGFFSSWFLSFLTSRVTQRIYEQEEASAKEIFSIFLFLLHRHLLFPFQHHFHFPVGILQTNMLYIHSLLPIILFKYLINFSFSSYHLNPFTMMLLLCKIVCCRSRKNWFIWETQRQIYFHLRTFISLFSPIYSLSLSLPFLIFQQTKICM